MLTLTLTMTAVQVIRVLMDEHGITSEVGVRLSNDEAGALTVSLAPWPNADDQVMEVSGARLFVDSDVAPAVDGKALDAAITDGGEVLFALNDRPHVVGARRAAHPPCGRHRRSRSRP